MKTRVDIKINHSGAEIEYSTNKAYLTWKQKSTQPWYSVMWANQYNVYEYAMIRCEQNFFPSAPALVCIENTTSRQHMNFIFCRFNKIKFVQARLTC